MLTHTSERLHLCMFMLQRPEVIAFDTYSHRTDDDLDLVLLPILYNCRSSVLSPAQGYRSRQARERRLEQKCEALQVSYLFCVALPCVCLLTGSTRTCVSGSNSELLLCKHIKLCLVRSVVLRKPVVTFCRPKSTSWSSMSVTTLWRGR